MKVPDVRRNLVPDTWTTYGEGALPVNWIRVLMTTAALVVEERSGRRPDSSQLNLITCRSYMLQYFFFGFHGYYSVCHFVLMKYCVILHGIFVK